MGDSQCSLFQPEFNRSIRVEARRERLSADAGALLLRELMDRLGYPELFRKHLRDPRDSLRVKHPQVELLRTVLLMLAQGWSAHSDVRLVREDPALCLAVSSRRGQRPLREAGSGEVEGLCSQPTLSRLLTALGSGENRSGRPEPPRGAEGALPGPLLPGEQCIRLGGGRSVAAGALPQAG
jgi:hypothetical protein